MWDTWKTYFFTGNPVKPVPDTWAQMFVPIWAKNLKIGHVWAGSGKSKKGMDLKFGSSVLGLSIAHNISKNQLDRPKTVVANVVNPIGFLLSNPQTPVLVVDSRILSLYSLYECEIFESEPGESDRTCSESSEPGFWASEPGFQASKPGFRVSTLGLRV